MTRLAAARPVHRVDLLQQLYVPVEAAMRQIAQLIPVQRAAGKAVPPTLPQPGQQPQGRPGAARNGWLIRVIGQGQLDRFDRAELPGAGRGSRRFQQRLEGAFPRQRARAAAGRARGGAACSLALPGLHGGQHQSHRMLAVERGQAGAEGLLELEGRAVRRLEQRGDRVVLAGLPPHRAVQGVLRGIPVQVNDRMLAQARHPAGERGRPGGGQQEGGIEVRHSRGRHEPTLIGGTDSPASGSVGGDALADGEQLIHAGHAQMRAAAVRQVVE